MKFIILIFTFFIFPVFYGQTIPQISQEDEKKQNSQILYLIDLLLTNPYELYINDIKASFSYETYENGKNATVKLNPYVLKNGKYSVKLRLYPKKNETTISPKEIEKSIIRLATGIKRKSYTDILDIKNFEILPSSDSLKFFEQEWFMTLNGLPYELEGWDKGQDLSKMDFNILENKVIKFYKNLWDILDKGKVTDWMRENEVLLSEAYQYNYIEDVENSVKGHIEDFLEYSKIKMLPIEHYELKLYAQGRIVSLERTDEKNKGKGVLRRKLDNGDIIIYNIKLYLPENKNEFIIIRQ